MYDTYPCPCGENLVRDKDSPKYHCLGQGCVFGHMPFDPKVDGSIEEPSARLRAYVKRQLGATIPAPKQEFPCYKGVTV